MNYTTEIRKKAEAFANAIQQGNIRIVLQAQADYMTVENQVILFNFIADFDEENKVSEKFRKWLLQKSQIQHELF